MINTFSKCILLTKRHFSKPQATGSVVNEHSLLSHCKTFCIDQLSTQFDSTQLSEE